MTFEGDYAWSVSALLNGASLGDPAPLGSYTEFYWNARVGDAITYLSQFDPHEVVHVVLKGSQVRS